MGKLGVVIVAAGKGSRMRTAESKQYLPLGGKPILVHTLETWNRLEEVDSIVLVVGENDLSRCQAYIEQYGLVKVRQVIMGGEERQASVHAGLRTFSEDYEWVMVHDGVRPFVRPEQVRACLRQAMESGGAVLAVPVKDTIKVADSDGWIQSTPDRRSLWAIQTPQAFRLSSLKQAYEQAEKEGFLGTDDAMLAERIGLKVRVVEGSYENIKITTPEDLPWAEDLMRRSRERDNR
ncbi:2-C-methyl-D-erythritol 4-phosphate cytidylyltransferase [Paenibacillus aurantius]